MRTVFVINPKAGKGKKVSELIEKISSLITTRNVDCDLYLTKSQGDATRFVKEYCKEKGPSRFIACGGDGTLSEVVNGLIEFSDAEVGVIPIGTGNDFCRNFPDSADFFDLELQISSKSIPCDVIHYDTIIDGVRKQGVCANMFNIGFDCNVADKTNDLKAKTIFSGSFSYLLSILWNLIQKKSINLAVEVDGKKQCDAKFLLCSIANGKYCGGGIMSNPFAKLTDGRINFNLIQNVSRLRFLSLLPSYIKGTHFGKKGIEKIIKSKYCKTLKVIPKAGTMRLCIDGEIVTSGNTTFTVLAGGVKFVLPQRTNTITNEISKQIKQLN